MRGEDPDVSLSRTVSIFGGLSNTPEDAFNIGSETSGSSRFMAQFSLKDLAVCHDG